MIIKLGCGNTIEELTAVTRIISAGGDGAEILRTKILTGIWATIKVRISKEALINPLLQTLNDVAGTGVILISKHREWRDYGFFTRRH